MLVLLFAACQQAPKATVVTEGPAVENLTKVLNAWVDGDWATYRAAFADTATIVFNTQEFDPDSLVRWQQVRRASYDKVAYSTDAMESITYENGEVWTHFWGKLTLTIKGTGRVVDVPIHLADNVVNGKSVQQFGYYDALNITNAVREAISAPPPSTK